jgi:hypothetical protein
MNNPFGPPDCDRAGPLAASAAACREHAKPSAPSNRMVSPANITGDLANITGNLANITGTLTRRRPTCGIRRNPTRFADWHGSCYSFTTPDQPQRGRNLVSTRYARGPDRRPLPSEIRGAVAVKDVEGVPCLASREFVEVSMSNRTHPAQDDHRTIRPSTAPGLDLDEVRKAVEGIRYGEVRLIIQDGIIVQIDRVEKRRLR